ncbi:MAG: glycerol-3-phosphate dehydrogenase/oxidase [Bacteroidetes bacterium]|nr:glycerol-3-phosphate dehydrogenase/oxidase [Bacteroidota bacterium]
MQQFSFTARKEILNQLPDVVYDVLVIGGGITAAGIALDAASRGLRVCVIEKNDFASGTSSKSTKLIHGGLRYLKNMEFALVREVGSERAVIHSLAPYLVQPISMLLPIYKNGTLGRITTAIALTIYDWLAKVKQEERFRMLKKKELLQLEPLLNNHNLIGGALYKEYKTDDARLTITVMKTAVNYGADCLNYCKYELPIYNNSKIAGAEITDELNHTKLIIHAKYIINAAGPWVDEIRKSDTAISGKFLHLTKGVHIVVSKKDFPLQQAIYFDVQSDKRMIFAIPRQDIIYIGTTDTDFNNNIDNPEITETDITYLLNAVNEKFKDLNLSTAMVQSTWAGLRPLIHETGKAPGELSRKDEIFISESGMISIAGGKLTGYRKMAEKTVDIVAKKMQNKSTCKTDTLKLTGADFQIPISEFIERRFGEAKQAGFTKENIAKLVYRYGTATEIIIENAFQLYHQYPNVEERKLAAEIQYTVEHEMVCNLSDFLIRRTGMLYFEIAKAKSVYIFVACVIKQLLQLSEDEYQWQVDMFEEDLNLI